MKVYKLSFNVFVLVSFLARDRKTSREEDILTRKVNLLLEFRGYKIVKERQEKYFKDLNAVSKRDETKILIRIILKTKLLSGKVGVRQVRKMKKKMDEEGYERGILIGPSFSYSARNGAKAKGIEVIETSSIPSFNIFEHELVPKHEILGKEEREELLKKCHIHPYQIPHIKRTDPTVFLIGAKPGDIIKITRKSPTAGTYVTYRYVI